MTKKKPTKFLSKMEVAAKQLGEMAIESNGTSVLFISTEKVDEKIRHVTQVQGSTQGIIAGLVGFATDPQTEELFKEVIKIVNKK